MRTPEEKQRLCRRIAAEGMVLLENNGVLPMNLKGAPIALFGSGARRTIPGGTGSGEVNASHYVSVEEGLEKAGAIIANKSWLDRYDALVEKTLNDWYEKQRRELGEKFHPWVMYSCALPAAVPVEPEDLSGAEGRTAIYVIGRSSGEGYDRKNAPGDYQLDETEKAALTSVAQAFAHVVVVLNVGGVIDTAFLRSLPGIDAVLLMSQAGQAAGEALADVLTGEVTPCGHLTTTWAENYADYPNADRFGVLSGDADDEYYTEGIYVGYRWFDTFGYQPAYPFGYGLSYTDFEMTPVDWAVDAKEVRLRVRVRNTGSRFPGKALAQLYVSAPAGLLEKPCQELKAFAKTDRIAPGAEETVTLTFPTHALASFDEEECCWTAEAGDYILRLGSHAGDTKPVLKLHLERTRSDEPLYPIMPLDVEMALLHPAGQPTWDAAEVPAVSIPDISWPVRPAPAVVSDARADHLTKEEMAALCVGVSKDDNAAASVFGMASKSCPGAAGETTLALAKHGIDRLILADGPAGLRLCPTYLTNAENQVVWSAHPMARKFDQWIPEAPKPEGDDLKLHEQPCTAIPVATLLAQTWDPALIRLAGDLVAEEMVTLGVDLWLAPGMNIHRNPLCGRNFEYYSEDPLLTGLCAAAMTEGVQAHPGAGVTIKHFACNNVEDNRFFCNSHVTHRALREIYLKGFEIAVRQAQPHALMTSYNLLNGIHTANALDILTHALREEWGFAGLVMTDWGTTNPRREGGKYGCSDPALCIHAGNDVIMPGSAQDIQGILDGLGTKVTEAELRACAARILTVLARLRNAAK
mgnify:CR=1 FL=1